MYHEKHCDRCLELLGAKWSMVHRWLDALARVNPSAPFDVHHRKHRHNLEGVETIRAVWGDAAAEAAILHIKDDIYGPCPHTDAQKIPKDEKEYESWGMQ